MNTSTNKKRISNPRQRANLLSAITFFYTIPTFIEGYRKGFDENSIYDTVADYRSDILGNEVEILFNKEVKRANEAKRDPSLRRVLFQAFGPKLLFWGLWLAVSQCIIRPAQALLVGRIVSFYTLNNGSAAELGILPFAYGLILITVVNVALFHPSMANAHLLGLKAKIACSSLIYRKTLKLNHAALSQTSVGQIINLLSNDVVILTRSALLLNYLWVAPLQCIIVTCIMYREVGVSAIIGVLLLILFIPGYYFLGKGASKFRSKTASRTDERVRFMNEIISGIQTVKMYAWEKGIEKLLISLRKLEMKYIKLTCYTKSIYFTFNILVIPIVLYATIVTYVLHNDISAAMVFTLTVFYNTLQLTMAWTFPQGLGLMAETLISIDRVNKFLINTEVPIGNWKNFEDPFAIRVTDGTAKWNTEVILKDITLTIKRGHLVAVVGQVGSGKSSLINVMLKELPLISGEVLMNGKVSYTSQDPWLFNGSIRDNILFGEKMDLVRYNEVVRRCALQNDFDFFPFSDGTIVGGRGMSVSGGQKARISLARAIYRDADIYLLDEPFSAVDAGVGKQIYQECIKSFLKGKTVILVTHQRQYLNDVDEIIVLDDGVIQPQERWEKGDCLKHSVDDYDELPSARCELMKGNTQKVEEVVKEQMSAGSVSVNVYAAYMALGGSIPFVVFTIFLLLFTEVLLSINSYFLSYWVNNHAAEGNIQLNAQGNFSNPTIIKGYSKEMNIYIYSSITFACIVIASLRSYIFFSLCLGSTKNLHNNMLNSVLRASMRFFNTNSQGRIINRFSQDTEVADTQLSTIIISTTQVFLGLLSSVLLVTFVNYWFLIPTVVIGVILFLIKALCLITIRNFKRLEGVTRSPVFEHLSSSLQGLSTIRAFQAEKSLKREFDSHLDLNCSCYHLFVSTSQALGLYLDYMSCIYIAVVTLTIAIFDKEIPGGNVGLAITQCLNLTMYLQWAMRQSAQLENDMTSVERILEFNSIEHEDNSNGEVPTAWPQNGEIIFQNVHLRYTPESQPILKNLNFKIKSKEKIGIIGRTGAGKTSIVNCLFRLSYSSGKVLIDGIDINNVNLQKLRSKISIIPQNPVLFSGTLRNNLDPLEEFVDGELWGVLNEVELRDFFASHPSGLDFAISQGGSNVSVGQRQLICLARAILRNNKILVLDEATASIDPETDALIQKTIRKRFENCTVICIAHRLDTVVDCDRIMVMSSGKVVEFDSPEVLLRNVDGYFYHMVQQVENSSTT
ncbi:hypothetical protein RI129_005431 [Pyrocoelia pectoralis]|uniref:Multidrug resistance-associated protein lethal(2)03659 n=1 Tax=Pyrocoelia pectoralis TaxID=417401 RepID=A0AAN7ZKD7_9COLE